jgi:hypothetical protein
MFNQSVINGRMREIELQLGTQRSWRIYAVDRWNEILKQKEYKNIEAKSGQEKWNVLKKELQKGLDPKYCGRLNELKDEFLKLIDWYFEGRKTKKDIYGNYELPSSIKHFPCILRTLIVLWWLVIIAAVSTIAMTIVFM